MSDLVGNPEYRFSHNEAQIVQVEDEHKKLGVICGKRPVAPMFTRTSIMYVMSVLDPAIAKDFKFSATYRIEDRKYVFSLFREHHCTHRQTFFHYYPVPVMALDLTAMRQNAYK